MPSRVSIVIPTWNRRDLLAECLQALSAQTLQDFETIVVDDASTDDTAAFVREEYPAIRLTRLESNRGFAAAVNTGILLARGEWILLLNNDVTLAPDCLERLLAGAAAADADMVAPLILWRDEPDRVYAAGDRILPNGRPESIGFRASLDDFQLPARIFGVSAAAGCYRRAIFDTAGLLDERFIAYFEDADLCFRARLAGFKAALVPEARAWHVGSASIAGRTWWRSAQCHRNHALLVLKNIPVALLLRFGPAIFAERLHQTRMLFSSSRAAFGAARALAVLAQSWLSLWRRIPGTLWERRHVQRMRRLSVSAVRALLEDSINDGA